jgi:hypothetical protein
MRAMRRTGCSCGKALTAADGQLSFGPDLVVLEDLDLAGAYIGLREEQLDWTRAGTQRFEVDRLSQQWRSGLKLSGFLSWYGESSRPGRSGPACARHRLCKVRGNYLSKCPFPAGVVFAARQGKPILNRRDP